MEGGVEYLLLTICSNPGEHIDYYTSTKYFFLTSRRISKYVPSRKDCWES